MSLVHPQLFDEDQGFCVRSFLMCHGCCGLLSQSGSHSNQRHGLKSASSEISHHGLAVA